LAGDADQLIGASLSDRPELEENVVHDPSHGAGGVPAVSEPREIAEPSEYLTTPAVAKKLAWSARTMRSKIASGFFMAGREFVQPDGCQPRWVWSAVVARMEGRHAGARDAEGGREVQELRLARAGGRGLV
jgi:hypothetical protein